MKFLAVAIAICFTCGIAMGNSYGHANPQLLERLSGAAVPTLRTDTNGAIHILANGKMLEGSCFLPGPQVAAQVNSTQPQTPQDQQRSQQQ
jgi:hypothetical protein